MNFEITMAVVTFLAILFSPTIAVQVTERLNEKKRMVKRKLDIYRSLMKTRNTPFDAEHVYAINMIEVEFYNEQEIVKKLVDYIKFRRNIEPTELEAFQKHSADGQDLLIELIHEIGTNLGYKKDKKELQANAYVPERWQTDYAVSKLNALAINDLLNGKTKLPIIVSSDLPAKPVTKSEEKNGNEED